MKRLAKEGNRTKWLNEAVSLYANNYHVVNNTSDNTVLLEKLDEIKSLLLDMNREPLTEEKKIAFKGTGNAAEEDQEEFFQLLSTGFNQGL